LGKILYNKNLSDLVEKIYAYGNDKNGLSTEELTINDRNENLELSKDLNSNTIQIYNMNLKLLVKLR
jgi:hypothetical protein